MKPQLHLITDTVLQQRYSHRQWAAFAAQAGADVVQYREKRHLTTRELVAEAQAMAEDVHGSRTQLVINDRVDVAFAIGVPNVHLGKNDMAPTIARRLLGKGCQVGGTANNLQEALNAQAAGVDYIGVGPVFGTQSKLLPAPTLGLRALAEIISEVDVPVIAIGGIGVEQVNDVMATGVAGIAVISCVVQAADPLAVLYRLRELLDAGATS